MTVIGKMTVVVSCGHYRAFYVVIVPLDFFTVGIRLLDTSGNQMVNLCPIDEWSVN